MSGRRTLLILAVLFLLPLASVATPGAPTVRITTPFNGSLLSDHTVNVSGMASGSDYQWKQGSKADYDTGKMSGLAYNSTGALFLDRTVYDDFDDNSFNTSMWSRLNAGGITTVEENKGLHHKGRNTAGGYWNGWSRVTSTGTVPGIVSADLTSFGGSGGGYLAMLVLYQDDDNWIGCGLDLDIGAYGSSVWVCYSYVSGGSFWGTILHKVTAGSHNYMIKYTGGTAYLYEDQTELGKKTLTLTGLKVRFASNTLSSGDTVDATWDNVRTVYGANGTYTSAVHDSRATYPVLKRVDWNATEPSDTELDVDVRMADAANMSGATEWTPVTEGQTTGLPSMLRYVQYRAWLNTSDNLTSPSLTDISILYGKPIARVEVSIDGGVSWQNATGLRPWYLEVELPENGSTIRVRATDVTGDADVETVRVDVDMTPPQGSILINHGDALTANARVDLTFAATDHYGVVGMLVGERPDLSDATWLQFSSGISWLLSSGDGNRTVYAMFRDKAGWDSAIVNDTIMLDTQPPVGSVLINDGARYTNSTLVRLALPATDLSGVFEMRLSRSPDLSGAAWATYRDRMDWTVPVDDGEKTVYVQFRDRLGHVSATMNDTIILDTTPPYVTVVRLDDGAAYTNDREVAFALEVVEEYEPAFMWLGEDALFRTGTFRPCGQNGRFTFSPADGTKTLFVRVQDRAGNIGPAANASIILDTSLPLVRIVIDGGALHTPLRNVTIELEVTDAVPVILMQLGGTADLEGVALEPFGPVVTRLLTGEDGTKAFYARVHDAAGNVGPVSSAIIVLDTTPPSMAMSIGDGAPYTGSRTVRVHIDARDNLGVMDLQLGGEPSLAGAPFLPFGAVMDWVLPSGDGPKVVYGRARDLAGNLGPIVSASVVLDTTAPLLGLAIAGGAQRTNTTAIALEVEATEAYGVASMELGEDPSFGLARTMPFASLVDVRLSMGDGPKTLYARARDLAGNVGPTATASIVLDMTPPVTRLTIGDGENYTASAQVTLRLEASDESGLTQMLLGEDPALFGATPTTYTNETQWRLSPGDGTKDVYARVRDDVGNWGAIVSARVVLDTAPPVVTIGGEAPSTGETDIVVHWQGADAGSGLRWFDVQYRDGTGDWTDWLVRTEATSGTFVGTYGHTYYFRARASDRVGNEAAFPEDEGAFARVTVPEPVRFTEGPVFALLVILIIVVTITVGVGYRIWSRPAKAR